MNASPNSWPRSKGRSRELPVRLRALPGWAPCWHALLRRGLPRQGPPGTENRASANGARSRACNAYKPSDTAQVGGVSDRSRVVRVEDGAPCLAVQHKDAPDVLGMGKTSFEKYVAPDIRCVRRGSLRLYMVRDLERWLDQNAERVL
jgi:hypothetical protein